MRPNYRQSASSASEKMPQCHQHRAITENHAAFFEIS